MGKTFFAKRWQADLERQGKPAIYFNVWETDFAADPLLPLLQAITDYVKSLGLESPEKTALIDKAKNVTKAIAPAIIRAASKGAIKFATGGLTDGKIDTWEEVVTTATLDELGKLAQVKVNAFAKEQDARKSFKVQLKELRETLLQAQKSDSTDNKIYIFVDELDRCRPPYALEFLETVKHLFDVKGFVFILCVDEGALQNTAQQIYGAPSEGEGYLRKFIDFRFQLPPPSYLATAEYLFEKYKLAEIITEGKWDAFFGREAYVICFSKWAQFLNLTLRQQSDVFGLLNTTLRYIGQEQSIPAVPIIGLVALRETRPSEWNNFQSNIHLFKEFYGGSWPLTSSKLNAEYTKRARDHFFRKEHLDRRSSVDDHSFYQSILSSSTFETTQTREYMNFLYQTIELTANPK